MVCAINYILFISQILYENLQCIILHLFISFPFSIYYLYFWLFSGYPKAARDDKAVTDISALPESIMDYLCLKFEGVVVETKVVRDYYWKPDIKKLVDSKVNFQT